MDKKVKFEKKLFLEKKAISRLDDATLQSIQGGAASSSSSCPLSSSCPQSYTCNCSNCNTFTCPKSLN